MFSLVIGMFKSLSSRAIFLKWDCSHCFRRLRGSELEGWGFVMIVIRGLIYLRIVVIGIGFYSFLGFVYYGSCKD